MCYGQVLFSFIEFGLNALYTKRILNYGLWPQIKVMVPCFLCSMIVLAEGLLISHLIETPWVSLTVSIVICPTTYLLMSKALRLFAYQEASELIRGRYTRSE